MTQDARAVIIQRVAQHLPAWLDLIPTAAALDPCYDPTATSLPGGAPVTPTMRTWLSNLADTRGIRSRAAAFRTLAEAHARSDEAPQRWLSLACGAAHPTVTALKHLRGEGIAPRVDLVDLDSMALSLATTYAARAGVPEQVSTHRMNVLGLNGIAPIGVRHRFRSPLAPRYDLVEAIGLLEYLRLEDWPYRYNQVVRTTRMLAGAVTFLRNAWALVRPGGMLVFGNMLDSHPQLAFTLNVIQWPHIQPRPVHVMIGAIEAAGIEGDRRVTLPADGVYAIYSIRKPE